MKGFQLPERDAATKSSDRVLFTLEQAHRALPLVKRIVADIVAQYRQLERLQTLRRKWLTQGREGAAAKLDRRAAEGAARLNDLINEVNAIGCVVKDWEAGMVDFRTVHDGREVLLCWKLGEDRIRHWHEANAGASARRPIDAAFRRPRGLRRTPA